MEYNGDNGCLLSYNQWTNLNKEFLEVVNQLSHRTCDIQYHYYKEFKLLLQRGVDVDIRDSIDRTPLMVAACFSYCKIVQLFIEFGADLNAKDCNGSTALMYASRNGLKQIVKILSEAVADF